MSKQVAAASRLFTAQKKKGFKSQEANLALLLTLPTVVWVLSIILYPIIYNIGLSFGIDKGTFSLQYYENVLSDSDTWKELYRTLVWTFGSVLIIVPFGLAIAVLLNSDLPGLKHVRTWFLLPWLFPVIVVVLIWRWILEPNVGISNYVLQKIGVIDQAINFISVDTAMIAVILVNAWRWIPFLTIVLLAALQNFPKELDEAAAVDGATRINRFWYITLPQLFPTLGVNTFIILMWLFNMFPPIWLMTRGGPNEVTTTLPISLYQTGFELFKVNEGAVLSVMLLISVGIFAIIYLKVFKKIGSKGS